MDDSMSNSKLGLSLKYAHKVLNINKCPIT